MIHNQKNMTNNGATERLLNLFCEIKTFNTIARQKLTCPILSLPANDEYWSEGWQNSVHSYVCSDLYATPSNKNELLVSMPSVSSPVSSNSSSPSPSQSDQSNASSVKMQPYCELDFDYVNEQVYHTSFLEKVGVNFSTFSISKLYCLFSLPSSFFLSVSCFFSSHLIGTSSILWPGYEQLLVCFILQD